jgi:hypothetical protein
MQSTTIIAFDQHTSTTMAAVLPPGCGRRRFTRGHLTVPRFSASSNAFGARGQWPVHGEFQNAKEICDSPYTGS